MVDTAQLHNLGRCAPEPAAAMADIQQVLCAAGYSITGQWMGAAQRWQVWVLQVGEAVAWTELCAVCRHVTIYNAVTCCMP